MSHTTLASARSFVGAAAVLLAATTLGRAAGAQDGGRAGPAGGTAVSPAPARTVPRLGGAPQQPRHALWVRVGALSSTNEVTGPGGEYEYERVVSSRFSLATRVQHWELDYGLPGMLITGDPAAPGQTHVVQRYVTSDVRARYWFGARPMQGWYVSGGLGYIRAAASAQDRFNSLYTIRHGLMTSQEVGYTHLFGDGARNRLGVTLAIGAQQYHFLNRDPGIARNPIGPRLRIGWTF